MLMTYGPLLMEFSLLRIPLPLKNARETSLITFAQLLGLWWHYFHIYHLALSQFMLMLQESSSALICRAPSMLGTLRKAPHPWNETDSLPALMEFTFWWQALLEVYSKNHFWRIEIFEASPAFLQEKRLFILQMLAVTSRNRDGKKH